MDLASSTDMLDTAILGETENFSFKIPNVSDNPTGWGPSTVPEKFKDTPYAPFSKGDTIGKGADWYQRNSYYNNNNNNNDRGGNSTNLTFSYKHDGDEDSFRFVSNKAEKPSYKRKFNNTWQMRNQQKQKNWQLQQLQGVSSGAKPKGQQNQRTRNNNWNNRQNNYRNNEKKIREPSVDVKDWELIDTVEFSEFARTTVKVAEPEDLIECGFLEYYNKEYNRVTAKNEKKLERIERTFFKVTTSDDPVIRNLANGNGNVFATDAILSVLMACKSSVYSWDIVVTKIGSKLFFDKRDNSNFDYLTVDETANDPPDSTDSINSPLALSQEATFINQNFSQQILSKGKSHTFSNPNPFQENLDDSDVAAVGYKYRKWDLGDGIELVARCEIDGILQDRGRDSFLSIKALNEYNPKTGVEWRKKIDVQRGAILATELKNNANKIAKWTAQALLSGADQMHLGYVSRANPKDSYNHVILGSHFYNTKEFVTQINLNFENMWSILKTLINRCTNLENGKYLFLKDPNRNCIHLYRVEPDSFTSE